MRRILVVLLAVVSVPAAAANWKVVAGALGRSGAELPGGVYKVGFPRTDLEVTLDGVRLRPALALGSWAAFRGSSPHTMVMGDLVLLEDEVNPVISALQSGGIEITAVHNHLLHETPRVVYVHYAGRGSAVRLATVLHDALALTRTPIQPPVAAPPAGAIDLPVSEIEHTLRGAGKTNGGVEQFAFARAETITDKGMTVPPSMGTATSINFQPTGGGHAAVTGDFVLIASEVTPVLRALRAGGIEVTALHTHMLDEHPKLYFMHFWANDDAVKLAKTLHTALDRTRLRR